MSVYFTVSQPSSKWNESDRQPTTTSSPPYSPTHPMVTSTNTNHRCQGNVSFTFRRYCLCVRSHAEDLNILTGRVEAIMRPAMDRKIFSAFAPAKHSQKANMNESFKRGLRNALTGLYISPSVARNKADD